MHWSAIVVLVVVSTVIFGGIAVCVYIASRKKGC
jgi:uncharacterized membrane protein